MSLKPFKFVVVSVFVDEDEDGRILGEVTTDPLTLYGMDGLLDFVDKFNDELTELNERRDGAPDA